MTWGRIRDNMLTKGNVPQDDMDFHWNTCAGMQRSALPLGQGKRLCDVDAVATAVGTARRNFPTKGDCDQGRRTPQKYF